MSTATFTVPSDGWSYRPSQRDAIVLMAALYGETRGGHSRQEWIRMLWTWMNRFALKTNRPWSSLAELVMAHSQPVNPKWRAGGSFCGPGGKYHGDQRYCSSAQLAWRAKMASIIESEDWSKVPTDIAATVRSFVDGEIPEPETVDGYALIDFGATKAAKRHGTQYEDGGNWYLTILQAKSSPLASSFILDHVVTDTHGDEGGDGGDDGDWSSGLLTLLALPAGYYIYKLVRKLIG